MKKYLITGTILFLMSYLQYLLPSSVVNAPILAIFWFLFMIGIILICDGTTQALYQRSLLKELLTNKKSLFTFVLLAIIGGIILDGTAQWLGKLWIYPYFNTYTYALFFIPCFTFYWLMILESYLAVKALLDYYHKKQSRSTAHHLLKPPFYILLSLSGIVLIIVSIALILNDYRNSGEYFFNVNTYIKFDSSFAYIISIFLGVWFILESIQYFRKKSSLLQEVINQNFHPLLAIIIASIILALIMETENNLLGFWRYTNWPFEAYQIFHLPIMMFVAWPLHYNAFLSLFRAFTDQESSTVWNSSLLNKR